MDIKLDDVLFEKISSGSKTVEVFLNDGQMKHFGVGDTIAIHRGSNDEDMVLVSAWSIKKCRNLAELYQKYSPAAVGMEQAELAQLYSAEDIKKHGLLAIKIKLLKPNFE
ncbi:hypothetical protein [Liquorilactobacillus satsumensis]|uniref:ASCH domain-containing protein n=1 Tax=Liquorilactobacillus satsumensis DSM 16230 = JCM 12392 TaxID=1423801 RepID=A0A0R1UUI8_9LACO|nr:hypothetical protein [Liquorilactobacillus satsumensis]KRL96861.1 hypothetical protein FD50_GL002147 [Liquorilactobacillus satsumensis DSM 16230 = JCM 12392]MCC7667081.1 ASCH protein [Liquorilactobacillus satsumensis]MCP9328495.1 ASCH protein [Liquorilactobacillus satsumensis]MCP9358261.1 ASCH protein [Liquorilactobacillus satsumensis]MCP9372215.1 ASCH protein [Liquorilactobacillus satsumensis]